MSALGHVNGVAVISAAAVPWKQDDDDAVKQLCASRGLVLFDAGGKSDAIVIGNQAIIWERNGERFRAFPVPELRGVAPSRQERMWAARVPGADGSSLVMRWNENAAPADANGAEVEMIQAGSMRYRMPITKRELRRLLAVAVDWPGVR